jgi:tetratricopeptide (TPR) repeat protein
MLAWKDTLGYLQRSPAGSASTDSIVRKLFTLLARTHRMMGDSQKALAACAKGLELDPADAELWFRKAMVHRHRGESTEAEKCWRLILTLKRPNQFLASIREFTAISPGGIWPSWPSSAAITPRRDARRKKCSPNAPAIVRHW